jgi:hypothetical protein
MVHLSLELGEVNHAPRQTASVFFNTLLDELCWPSHRQPAMPFLIAAVVVLLGGLLAFGGKGRKVRTRRQFIASVKSRATFWRRWRKPEG